MSQETEAFRFHASQLARDAAVEPNRHERMRDLSRKLLNKLIFGYLASAILIFSLAATAKLVGRKVPAQIHMADPFIWFLTGGQLLTIVSVLEISVVILIALNMRRSPTRVIGLVLWLASVFLLYRIGFVLAPEYAGASCKCLGGIFGSRSDLVALGMIVYLLTFGSLLSVASFFLNRASVQLQTGPLST